MRNCRIGACYNVQNDVSHVHGGKCCYGFEQPIQHERCLNAIVDHLKQSGHIFWLKEHHLGGSMPMHSFVCCLSQILDKNIYNRQAPCLNLFVPYYAVTSRTGTEIQQHSYLL